MEDTEKKHIPVGLRNQKTGAAVEADRIAREHPTPQQEAFCQAYMECFSIPEAYRRAGYKGKHSRTNGYRLFHLPFVEKRIAELKEERLQESKLTLEKVRDALVNIAEKAEDEGRYSSAIRAWELLGKYLGMFTEKATLDITINRTSKELDTEIARLTKIINGPTSD
jgi:phage terminase small subunit